MISNEALLSHYKSEDVMYIFRNSVVKQSSYKG
jgi:hypothetical protein